MPRIPKWMADAMEKISKKHYHLVKVTRAEMLDSRLKLIEFSGDINSSDFIPGNVIEFRVSDTEFRHYTPSYYDPIKGTCEVIFYLHSQGIGSKWASNLKIGDELKLIGPGGKMHLIKDINHHVLFGDETSLGLQNAMCEKVHGENQKFTSILEISEENIDWQYINKLEGKVNICVSEVNQPGKNALKVIEKIKDEFDENSIFYLTGRAKSIQTVRKELLSFGINKKQIQTYPYWEIGKKGL